MKLRVRVTWENAGTPLLPEAHADVRLEAGGAPLPLLQSALGVREFEVPEGTAKVKLTASFSASFGAVSLPNQQTAPPMKREVLRIEQPYDVVENGSSLRPERLPEYVGPHPLAETTAVANVRGAALVRLRTDFVDITPFWEKYAFDYGDFIADPGVELCVLGATGAEPKIWFASVPAACHAPPRPGISALVFFRPASDPYDRIDQAHEMLGLNRYLLKPLCSEKATFQELDHFTLPPPEVKDGTIWIWVRCRFQYALRRSGRAVVMLHPWPSGLEYGAATSSELPRLAEAAIRLLWAKQKIARMRGAIHLGKLALSGYSSGGGALWKALSRNLDRVSEVYSFDTRGTQGNAGMIVQWFNAKPTRRLRMTGGHQLAANEAIRRAIERTGGSPGDRFLAVPSDESAYLPGASPVWDHACQNITPAQRQYHGLWHQYAAFGGYPVSRDEEEKKEAKKKGDVGDEVMPFLQLFLQESDL